MGFYDKTKIASFGLKAELQRLGLTRKFDILTIKKDEWVLKNGMMGESVSERSERAGGGVAGFGRKQFLMGL